MMLATGGVGRPYANHNSRFGEATHQSESPALSKRYSPLVIQMCAALFAVKTTERFARLGFLLVKWRLRNQVLSADLLCSRPGNGDEYN
jgi:hypothetical protein